MSNQAKGNLTKPLASWVKWLILVLMVCILGGAIWFALNQKNNMVVVNGEKITVVEAKALLGQYYLYDETVKVDNVYYQENIAPYAALDKLLVQEATARGLTVTNEEVAKSAVDTIKSLELYFLYQAATNAKLEMDSAALYGSDAAAAEAEASRLAGLLGKTGAQLLDEKLTTGSITRDYFTASARTNLLTTQLYAEIKAELVYTDEEITAYYGKHLLDKYTQKDSSHILVADEATANLVYDKLVAGENFLALSDEYSTDTTAKANGGKIGYYGQTGLVAEYTTALFALTEVGQISTPVKTEFGWHIIRLDGIKVTPMSEAIATIKTDMVDNKTNAILRTVVEKANIRPTSAKSAMLGMLADK